IDEVVNALKVKKDKIESKGIKSIRSRVTNIKDYLPQDKQSMTTEEFRQAILLQIFGVDNVDQVKTHELTEDDWQAINKISEEYYKNWDWNYGRSPEFNLERQKRFPIGSIEVRLDVVGGSIEKAKIFGDFFGLGEIKDVEDQLIGTRYDKHALTEVIDQLDLTHYFGNITKEDFLALIY
ncbi:MAG: lipoate protein ligase C-terminal domain-containing protein, partial [Enterococcus sp.]